MEKPFHTANNEREQYFAFVYQMYSDRFLAWLNRRYAISIADAKDIFQSSVMILYYQLKTEKVKSFHCSLKTYIYAIGKNKAREFIRKSKRIKLVEDSLQRDRLNHPIRQKDRKHDDQLFSVLQSLDKLPSRTRELLELHYFEKRSHAEIAAIMGYRNANSVKTQKYKALVRLRKLMDVKCN